MPSDSPFIVLKLGGSAITRKDEGHAAIRPSVLQSACAQIASARKKRGFRLVIAHGAGPFGHVPVKKYHLEDGLQGDLQLEGLCRTQLSVQKLGAQVAEHLLECGLRPILLQPADFLVFSNGHLAEGDASAIRRIAGLDPDLIPVLGGCLVPDRARGVSVCSGDVLAPWLASELGARTLLLGGDTGGVFEADPKLCPGARVIPEIDLSKPWCVEAGASRSTDVTGGMGGKLKALARHLGRAEAWIFSLTEGRLLEGFLSGSETGGTRLFLGD